MNIRYHLSLYVVMITALFLNQTTIGQMSFSSRQIDTNNYEFSLQLKLKKGDYIYKDYINFSVDHPDIVLSDWQASIEPVNHYDTDFKETKKIYNKSFTITLNAQTQSPTIEHAHLHFGYYQHSNKKITEKIVPLSFEEHQNKLVSTSEQSSNSPSITPQKQSTTTNLSWSGYIAHIIQSHESIWLRIIFALLLGLLLSLTPCIYPMIPITVGILQSQGSCSVARNFLLALSYTIGIATTFALLGLLAAFTSTLFGSIMTNPLFIIILVALLAYLAGSMIGLYDMYTPRFLTAQNNSVKGGSCVSAFLFGAASGTVASPCLSPGLLLLLSLVTALGNKILGFVLLFSFGIGLSLPLLVIGTFSSSLALLPQAGMWMVEVKKFFGFLMLGMCFYFMHNILPWHFLLPLFCLFIIGTGIFYLYTATNAHSSSWKQAKNGIGMFLVASSVFLGAKSYQALHTHEQTPDIWLHDYRQALTIAKEQDKKILLDISAPFCSICKAIDKKIFTNPSVIQHLESVVLIKINDLDSTNPTHKHIQKQFSIIGVPTFILIDAREQELKRWGSELYDKSPEEFVRELNTFK